MKEYKVITNVEADKMETAINKLSKQNYYVISIVGNTFSHATSGQGGNNVKTLFVVTMERLVDYDDF